MMEKLKRSIFAKVPNYILDSQYVRSGFSDCVYKVTGGTCQGLCISARVADVAYLHSTELCGPQWAIRWRQRDAGILGYIRYADNCYTWSAIKRRLTT